MMCVRAPVGRFPVEARAVRARMDTSAVQVVLAMGYSRDLLLKVIEHRLVTVGKCLHLDQIRLICAPRVQHRLPSKVKNTLANFAKVDKYLLAK